MLRSSELNGTVIIVIAGWVSNPGRGKKFLSFLKFQTGSGTRTASDQWELGSFRGIKRPGREADHPYLGLNKNKWSYTSTPPMRLHGLGGNKFTCV
jgi:hypothetical protein